MIGSSAGEPSGNSGGVQVCSGVSDAGMTGGIMMCSGGSSGGCWCWLALAIGVHGLGVRETAAHQRPRAGVNGREAAAVA